MRLADVSLREIQAWLNAQGVRAWERGKEGGRYYRGGRRWADDGAMGLRELWCMEERELVDEGVRRFFGGLDRMQRAAGGGSLGSVDGVLTQLIWEMWPVLNVALFRAAGSPPLARVSTRDGGYADAVRTVLKADPALAEAYAGNTLLYPGALPTALALPRSRKEVAALD